MGIDYLEVSPDQGRLIIYFVHSEEDVQGKNPVPANIGPANIRITGGVRIKEIIVDRVKPGPDLASLTVFVSDKSSDKGVGDFSTYTLRLVNVENMDPMLSTVDFSFKIGCLSEFDCKSELTCPPDRFQEPPIDYLSKDYASFRRLMLDRLSLTSPGWRERNPADIGIAVVEALAFAADHLSYYQDAAATEAYLGTARKRTSVRRHARFLDYPMHDGCNSRVWVAVAAGAGADGKILSGQSKDGPGTRFLTRVDALGGKAELTENEFEDALSAGAEVFEAVHDIVLHMGENEIHFYTWGESSCCLPKGSTEASLLNRGGAIDHLKEGDVLILEEIRGTDNGLPADRDPTHRWAVRLTSVKPTSDPLFSEEIVDVKWSADDALPFPLCISTVIGGITVENVSIARGNIVLADHGRTVEERLPKPDPGRFRPGLSMGPLTYQGSARSILAGRSIDERGRPMAFDPRASATAAMKWEMRDTLPAIKLIEPGGVWLPVRDLLSSGRFAREFVVESEDDGSASLRFGEGEMGMHPFTELLAVYRIGNGERGNIGAGSIAYVFSSIKGIEGVTNPIPASGGKDPESIEQVKLFAPQAFRIQERAVTEKDYASMAERHPEVQRAVAVFRWTGSWHTAFIAIDRMGGRAVDPEFEAEMIAFLERFRMAGVDIEIAGPVFVPLDIVLNVCVSPGFFRSEVKRALFEAFSDSDNPDGSRGFFHPDNFTFEDPVYLSQIISRAMQVSGVAWMGIDVVRGGKFQRWGEVSRGEVETGVIEMGRLEVPRLDNDPSNPEMGRIDFVMDGGQ